MATKRRERGTGNVRPDPGRPGSWIGAVQINGRRYSARGRTKTDVSARLAEIKAGVITGAPRSRNDLTVTVGAIIDRFVERELPNRRVHGRALAPGTIRNYRFYLGVVTDELGKVRLADLTVARVETMFDGLAARGFSRATLTKLSSMFATVVDSAMKLDLIHRNAVRLATLPPTAREAVRRRALVPDDARKLLAQLRHERNGALFAVSLLLGLRPGEAAALWWADVDLDAGTVNVTRGLQRDGGTVAIVDNLKTEASKRTIAMPADLTDWLREHRHAQRVERFAAHRWADEQLVFATPAGTVTDPSNNRDDLAAICARAGVPRTLPVELRHSCASLLSDLGVPNEQIADLLGHTTTRMVEATYRHRLRPVVDVAARADWRAVDAG